jgi:hypothetical protein
MDMTTLTTIGSIGFVFFAFVFFVEMLIWIYRETFSPWRDRRFKK